MTNEQELRLVTALEKLADGLERIAALHGECAAPTNGKDKEETARLDDAPKEKVTSPPSAKAKGHGIRTA